MTFARPRVSGQILAAVSPRRGASVVPSVAPRRRLPTARVTLFFFAPLRSVRRAQLGAL
jgi:hypothetical protein